MAVLYDAGENLSDTEYANGLNNRMASKLDYFLEL